MASPSSIPAQLEAAAAACARDGAQLTPLRRQVLEVLLSAGAPRTAYQLLDILRERRRNATPPTIYRALDFLLEHGLVHRIGRLNAYLPCTEAGPHAHAAQFLICRDCGGVQEIDESLVGEAIGDAATRAGFGIREMFVEVEGVCRACVEVMPANP
jgi:Fur family zinc uptake transcriptional regulator